ncbi:DNA internalization-related competence protein ComEC/Rec2 [Spiribacter roseus]|uniref:DNA internalization-related competence protein ComEC/Rec2 n=1 Tax=Spiribacter roseus TaxID=1855875 RepID=A0ABV3RZM9_9GAMM
MPRSVGDGLGALLAGLILAVMLPVGMAPALAIAIVLLPCLALPGRGQLPGWLALGVLVALLSQAAALERRPAVDRAETVNAVGRVVSLPQASDGRQRFLLRPESVAGVFRGLPRRIRISLYADEPAIGAGERWELPLRLRRPRGFMNPVRFDYEQWLASEHIDATAYVTEPDQARRLASGRGLVAWRAWMAAHLSELAATPGPGGALLRGLVVGDRRGFSETTWHVLQATGTSHLMAISGLHIGLVAGFGYWLGRWLWALARLPGERRLTASLIGVGAALTYAAMAGFALPTQRALMMLAVLALAALLGRRVGAGRLLLIAATGVVLMDPSALLGAGFWLSFVAVAVIILVVRGRRTGAVSGLWRIQLALLIGLAPLSGLFFGSWSPAGLLVNLLVLPLFSLLIVPLALPAAVISIGLPGPGGAVLHGLARLLDALVGAGEWLLDAGLGPWSLNPVDPLTGLGLATGLALWMVPAGRALRLLGVCLIGGFFLAGPEPPAPGAVTVTWLEVGQGNAAVIHTRRHTLVVDTGPAWSGGSNAAAFSLIPYLEQRGIERIDRLIVTHADRDHRGGVPALRQAVRIDRVDAGEPLAEFAEVRRCRHGQSWQRDGVRFEYLWPDAPGDASGNAASCVLHMRSAGGDVLFTGDIDQAIERRIAPRIDAPVVALEAPHHGSRTGSSAALLERASPRLAVLAAGYRNAYGMPHPAVIRRLRCRGIPLHDTGRHGALTLELHPQRAPRWRAARGPGGRLLHDSPRRRRFPDDPSIHYHPLSYPLLPMESRQPTCGN